MVKYTYHLPLQPSFSVQLSSMKLIHATLHLQSFPSSHAEALSSVDSHPIPSPPHVSAILPSVSGVAPCPPLGDRCSGLGVRPCRSRGRDLSVSRLCPVVCIDHILFILSSVWGLWDCVCLLAVVNNACMVAHMGGCTLVRLHVYGCTLVWLHTCTITHIWLHAGTLAHMVAHRMVAHVYSCTRMVALVW